jgi:uncharacterized protein with HEPN domain
MPKRDSLLYLQDIYTSIQKINKYTKDFTFADFKKDAKTIDAVIRNLEILGEAARYVDKNIKKENKQIPWRAMIEIRNKVIHEYFGVDASILWTTIKNDLPQVKKDIKELL